MDSIRGLPAKIMRLSLNSQPTHLRLHCQPACHPRYVPRTPAQLSAKTLSSCKPRRSQAIGRATPKTPCTLYDLRTNAQANRAVNKVTCKQRRLRMLS